MARVSSLRFSMCGRIARIEGARKRWPSAQGAGSQGPPSMPALMVAITLLPEIEAKPHAKPLVREARGILGIGG